MLAVTLSVSLLGLLLSGVVSVACTVHPYCNCQMVVHRLLNSAICIVVQHERTKLSLLGCTASKTTPQSVVKSSQQLGV